MRPSPPLTYLRVHFCFDPACPIPIALNIAMHCTIRVCWQTLLLEVRSPRMCNIIVKTYVWMLLPFAVALQGTKSATVNKRCHGSDHPRLFAFFLKPSSSLPTTAACPSSPVQVLANTRISISVIIRLLFGTVVRALCSHLGRVQFGRCWDTVIGNRRQGKLRKCCSNFGS